MTVKITHLIGLLGFWAWAVLATWADTLVGSEPVHGQMLGVATGLTIAYAIIQLAWGDRMESPE